MFKFWKGLAAAIGQKAVTEDQILYSQDTGELSFDIKDGNTTTRYTVKDPIAQSLDGNTILIL